MFEKLDSLRKPFLVAAFVLILCVVLMEQGSSWFLGWVGKSADDVNPGYGISYLWLVDGLLLLTVALFVSPLIITDRVHAMIQGAVTIIVAIVLLLLGFIMLFKAIAALILMVALLLSVPFGTIVYMIKFADFPRGEAAAALGVITAFKFAFCYCLVAAHPKFLENKGLVLIVTTSFVAGIIVSFLHSLLPGFLTSITDAIAAIVVSIIGMVWALILAVGAIPSLTKLLRADRLVG